MVRAVFEDKADTVDVVASEETAVERFLESLYVSLSFTDHQQIYQARSIAHGRRAQRMWRTDLFYSRDKLLWDIPTHDPIIKRRILSRLWVHLHRLNVSLDFTKLTRPAGLLFMRVVEFARLGDGLAERDAGLAGYARHVVFALHPFDVDF